MSKPFTVFALTYGDHTELARRCFSSIRRCLDPARVHSIRIGMNAVNPATVAMAHEVFAGCPVPVVVYDPGFNALKYPLMRKMFYCDEYPVSTPYVMWFDDDSCLTKEATPHWWKTVELQMYNSDITGHIYTMPFQGQQKKNIEKQPWYNGVPWSKDRKKRDAMRFATGGWWTVRSEILWKWGYPWPALHHNGGDSTLGEMISQQHYRLTHFDRQLWINSDSTGKPSSAGRRGEDQKPVWYRSPPEGGYDTSQHDFDVTPYRIDDVKKPVPLKQPANPMDGIVRIPGL